MKISMLAAVSALVLAAGSAGAATVVVPGTSDPFLAGAPSGSTVTFSTGDVDTATTDSPVGISVTPGEVLKIGDVTGTVSNGPCCAYAPPTGGSTVDSYSFTASFTELVSGFSNLPINSLVGVFYGPNPADANVDQVFEIGNGGTFTVPVGTTELYLATVDSYQWNNNLGAFNVSVSAVPEPATWAMMLVGFGGIGGALRMGRSNRKAATVRA